VILNFSRRAEKMTKTAKNKVFSHILTLKIDLQGRQNKGDGRVILKNHNEKIAGKRSGYPVRKTLKNTKNISKRDVFSMEKTEYKVELRSTTYRSEKKCRKNFLRHDSTFFRIVFYFY